MYMRIEKSFLNRYLPGWRAMTDVEILRRYADIIESGVLCQSNPLERARPLQSLVAGREDQDLLDANMRR